MKKVFESFAKIFETEHGQVLVYKGNNDDENGIPQIVYAVSLDSVCVDMKVSFGKDGNATDDDYEQRDIAFNKTTGESIKEIAINLREQLRDLGVCE